MAYQDIKIRVRPHRVAVMAPINISRKNFLYIVEFLSQLWGGNYCPIIPVNKKELQHML